MAQKIVEMVHDSITEEFTPTCRHCKGTLDEHAEGDEVTSGPCLFDATTWDPMTESEWVEWRRNLWAGLGDTGASFIRDKLQQPKGTAFIRDVLKQAVFASRVETDEMIYGNAGIEVSTDADKLTIKRLDPMALKNESLMSFIKKVDQATLPQIDVKDDDPK